MGRGNSLSEREVGTILAFHDTGLSEREIVRRTGRSKTAVHNCIQKAKMQPRNVPLGRRSVVSEVARRRVLRAASNDCRTSIKIKADLNLPFSARTVRRIIQSSDVIVRRKKSRKPILNDRQKQRRVAWAEAHLHWDLQWRKIVFSDEKKFRLDGPDGNNYYYHDRRKPELLQDKRHSGGGGLMVWVAIGWYGKSDIIFIEGNMKSEDYQQVLELGLLPYGGRIGGHNWIFQQDNAPIHTARATKAWLEDHGIRLLPWPPKSPDLNPVENVWGRLCQLVYANGRQFADVESLRACINECWRDISGEYRHALYNSMRRRLQEVIEKKGFIALY